MSSDNEDEGEEEEYQEEFGEEAMGESNESGDDDGVNSSDEDESEEESGEENDDDDDDDDDDDEEEGEGGGEKTKSGKDPVSSGGEEHDADHPARLSYPRLSVSYLCLPSLVRLSQVKQVLPEIKRLVCMLTVFSGIKVS